MAEPLSRLYFLFDRDHGPRDRFVPRWLFLRGLGLVYLSAFAALVYQVLGMSGSGGVLPAGQYLRALAPLGGQRFWLAPTVLWWNSSDHALLLLAWVGAGAALLVTVNVLPRAALLVCWVCFLSWVAVAQDFGQYQSDGMLLEAGLLAMLIAPAGVRPGWGTCSPGTRAAWLLLVWEWFRIYFESGVVKLASGDPTWRHLTALYEYYQNGPLPTWVGWYCQQMPFAMHRFLAALTLVMELGLVFLALLPRRWRVACFVLVTVWQIGVIATANYAFLNYLVLLLGVLLLDDEDVRRVVPRRFRGWFAGIGSKADAELGAVRAEGFLAGVRGSARAKGAVANRGLRRHPREVVRALRIALTTVVLCFVAYASTLLLLLLFTPRMPLPTSPITLLEPFRVANQYGLFANMTPHRYEVEFQGSDDGATWLPYGFRFKPQDVHARPGIYAPYQPRFDWNLWFASLTDWQHAPIVPRTEIRLLEGSTETLSLFRTNPFPSHPPRYVRAVLYQYRFATAAQHRTEGVWWTRKLLGTYAPTLTRTADGGVGAVAVPELNGPPDEGR